MNERDLQFERVEVSVTGLDCADCARHVKDAIEAIPGVLEVEILFSAQKAAVILDPAKAGLEDIRRAVKDAGYSIRKPEEGIAAKATFGGKFTRQILTLFGMVFGVVLFAAMVGEWLGLFEVATKLVPWPAWLAVILAGGWPVFWNVVRATAKGRITSHTLMTIGMLAAVAVGEWAAAILVVFFMRIGDYVETFTAERARRALKDLTAMAPQTARVERDGAEVEVSVTEVMVGETVIVRPGEKIPVDGEVVAGQATVDQATITGESMPVEAGTGAKVFAATIARFGSIRIRTLKVGADTTFGKVIKLVEQAEASQGEVQRLADKFSGYYLPVVAVIAILTFLIGRNPLATAAVLVVVCSCSFALATPLAMIASIGAGAKRGLLIKGGKYLEALNRADILLLDKTGTLTLGQPKITDIVVYGSFSETEVIALAASVERYSEHPLAEAVRSRAKEDNIPLLDPEEFKAIPGQGVRAVVNGRVIAVGSRRMLSDTNFVQSADQLEAQGKSILYVVCDGKVAGVLAAADTLRPEVPSALAEIRNLGIQTIELLTGDNERVAAPLAKKLDLQYRADLLPEDKIAIVRDYQSKGNVVVMVGDGVNDAPALAQADVGIAMGAAGSDIAIEAAHVALMREDWALVPEIFQIARRTMGVVKLNLVFTALYNVAGMSLAALGLLPLTLAAALQSLPDIGILANSSRLLRRKI
ncbi:cation-translocating P-type ATPase [Geobacter sp. DSM 9736]|uniref:heavy metal translocating P-type ATPase n=1 Tax=Geobacter sp. DSM 9736 TaxID=1277350 RepID=UPI000B5131E8|nr:cation-translocating P-type ATPase [Geobacter sp. DSM 9736]SNB45533.1 Cd2+/Zn2+-exporting ATPase/Cu+-exporting ATPase [Geobacter sp. DSM 9736]